MAMLAHVSFKYYDCAEDKYVLPDGRVYTGFEVREAKQRVRDQVDASTGYNPYNHTPA